MANENDNVETLEKEEGQNETVKTYTQEEVDSLLQREADRRVSEALKKQEKKLKEAEKLAQMSEAEKYEYQLQEREKAIEEKERALTLAENKNEASKILAEKGISLELVDFVIAETAEAMNANITLLEKAFKASVKAEVEKRLGGTTPKQSQNNEAMTKEQFMALSIDKQQALYNENPELYKTLIGG